MRKEQSGPPTPRKAFDPIEQRMKITTETQRTQRKEAEESDLYLPLYPLCALRASAVENLTIPSIFKEGH
jgi:hypothetical protein